MATNMVPAGASPASIPPAGPPPNGKEYTDDEVRQLVAALEEPFDPREIKWRVTNTTADRKRGQMLAYADPRAYTDRLNTLFTVRGWTRRYEVQTINNVERKLSNGSQIAGKVVVTCEVTIHGLGTHSGIGEEWADNENDPRFLALSRVYFFGYIGCIRVYML
jgi:Rad52/22 family double-strand break repair protein